MLPQIHLFLGLNGALLLNKGDFNNFSIIWFIIGSIFPDIDFFYGYVSKQNHRKFPTHYPILWLSMGCLFGLMGLSIFWFFLGAFIHVLVDLFDFEIYFFAPFIMIPISFLKLDYKKMMKNGSILKFLQNYYQNKTLVYLEVVTYGFFFLFIFIM
ncbi:MAG: metal-dependent hydrolase [Candidatus Hodarchaeota archaeon]